MQTSKVEESDLTSSLIDISDKFGSLPTPFYFYDVELLKRTIDKVKKISGQYGYKVHYAMKANVCDELLQLIHHAGFGSDCVSGNEVLKAISVGFPPSEIVFAGVGKSDTEITLALQNDIFCFNCESLMEIEVINEIAGKLGKKARIALRINPNVNANTHHYITTGLEENKFGINAWEFNDVIELIKSCQNISLEGLHFHVGSQITDLNVFGSLCLKVNEVHEWFENHGFKLNHLNVGGGLGVDYHHPDENSIADFEGYFEVFHKFLKLRPGQELHFELGRSIIAQCGSLISRVLYVKKGVKTNFLILDAGMTELIRPALYHSYHKIENISSAAASDFRYDVVGPICESSDCFGKGMMLPETNRGDLIAIRTTGAYGEVMASSYNLREKAPSVFSDKI